MGWIEALAESAAWHGVTTPEQAEAHGIPRRSWYRRVDGEGWPRPLDGATPRLLPGTPVSATARAAAALAHVGYPSALTRWSALHLLGVHRLEPPRVQLLLPAQRTAPLVPSIEVVRSRLIRPADLHDVDGLCCARPGRILADLAATTPHGRLRSVAIDLRFRDGGLLRELDEVHRARRRYPGRGRIGAILAELQGDGSDSGFEYTARDRFCGLGLPPDAQQAEVTAGGRTFHLDIAWTWARVGIECVGWAYHRSQDDQERDALRRNAITTADDDWAILALTWRMLHGPRWDRFVGQVATLLRKRAGRAPAVR